MRREVWRHAVVRVINFLRDGWVVVGFVILGLGGTALMIRFGDTRLFVQPPGVPVASSTMVRTPALRVAAALPTHLSIPAAHISADFETPLGLQPNGEIAAPKTYTEVAYYKYGPTPGELGPAVILGHVDSYRGPGVFYSLGQIKPGDAIIIDRADGSRLTFIIDSFERVLQAQFPTTAVYGPIDYAGLRLITCTGTYSHQTERYDKNLIVFAHLAAATTTPGR